MLHSARNQSLDFDFPSDFDPSRFPIIAAHRFGIIALPRPDDVGVLEAADKEAAA